MPLKNFDMNLFPIKFVKLKLKNNKEVQEKENFKLIFLKMLLFTNTPFFWLPPLFTLKKLK